MAFPAEHQGRVKKRAWYKVKWTGSPPGLEVKGKFDLLMEGDLEKYKNWLEVAEKIVTDSCTPGLPIGFGKTEEEVDSWVRKHRS